MRITAEMLREHFGACDGPALTRFRREYPQGLDISPLWGTPEEADVLWHQLLSDWRRRWVGWAIRAGVLPARIRANLHRADLANADLGGANLREANLRGANLAGANLCKANLRWANLAGADLRWVTLAGADLRGAHLRGATLIGVNLNGARWDSTTLWPEGFCPAEENNQEEWDER